MINLDDAFAEALHLASLLQGQLQSQQRIQQPGQQRQQQRGSGEEFWQYRRYGSGDSARAIDWRRSASTTHVLVREQQAEQSIPVQIILDPAPTMAFSGRSYAMAVCSMTLALLMTRNNTSFLLNEAHPWRPQAQSLVAYYAAACDLPAAAPRARTRILYVTDGLRDITSYQPALKSRQPILVQLATPEEADFPYTGTMTLGDPQGTISFATRDAAAIRSAYLHCYQAQCAALRAHCQATGWQYLFARTDQSLLPALREVLNAWA